MKYWQKVEQTLSRDGVTTLTQKLTIIDSEAQEHDFYLKVGWWRGRPVWIDITKARHAKEGTGDTLDIHQSALPLVTALRRRMIDLSRSTLEIICRQASLLLSTRRCRLEELADLWRVTETEPPGRCEQVVDDLGDKVHGPLDAVAKFLKMKGPEWEKRMTHQYTEEEIEQMIAECMEALEQRPDDFTGWETSFLEDVSDANETTHLTDSQVEKLEQIWEERNCG